MFKRDHQNEVLPFFHFLITSDSKDIYNVTKDYISDKDCSV